MKARKNQGFTLVEILIVVVILGILAAIVIPQFSDASTQSRVSSIQASLQTMRSQISLYKIQHKDVVPTVTTTLSDWDEMTQYTDIDGAALAAKDATHIYGPYLQSVPVNPFTDGVTIGDTTADWVYTAADGSIHPGYGGTTAISVDINGVSTDINTGL